MFFLLSNCLYAREVRLCHGHGLEERVPLGGGVADVEVDVVLNCIQRKIKKRIKYNTNAQSAQKIAI